MKIIKVENYKEMSEKAYEILKKEILKKPNSVIVFPAGKTPLGLYQLLVKAYEKKEIDFSKIRTFQLDEYFPIEKKDKRSFYSNLSKNLFKKINILIPNMNFFDSKTKNPEKECRDYEKKLKNNPIDITILGIGVNGHIGFNEPGSKLNSKIGVVKLKQETINRNSNLFGKVPEKAFTMGIKNVLSSKKIIILASGKEKAEAVKHFINEEVSEEWPASFLRKHKNLISIIDKNALEFS